MTTKALVISGIAIASALAGGWALAQTAGRRGFGAPFMHGQGSERMGSDMMEHMGTEMGHGMMKGHGMTKGTGRDMIRGRSGFGSADPAQIDALKSELGITPAQEQAWSTYAKAVRDAAAATKAAHEAVGRKAISKLSPADRFAFVTKMREQNEQQFEAVKTAASELLGTLDDSQKADAKNVLPGLTSFGQGMMREADRRAPHRWH